MSCLRSHRVQMASQVMPVHRGQNLLSPFPLKFQRNILVRTGKVGLNRKNSLPLICRPFNADKSMLYHCFQPARGVHKILCVD